MLNRRQFLITSAFAGSGLITSKLIIKSKKEELSAPGIITEENLNVILLKN